MTDETKLILVDQIGPLIHEIRRQKVVLDSDLAMLYGVETKALNRAIKRNPERFPSDFMFQTTAEEFDSLRYQSGTSNIRRGGRRYLPYVNSWHRPIRRKRKWAFTRFAIPPRSRRNRPDRPPRQSGRNAGDAPMLDRLGNRQRCVVRVLVERFAPNKGESTIRAADRRACSCIAKSSSKRVAGADV